MRVLLRIVFFTLCMPLFSLELEIPERKPGYPVLQIYYGKKNPETKVQTDSRELFFTKNGTVSREAVYNENGDLQWTILYKYDENGNLQEKAAIDNAGLSVWKYMYTYNTEGRMIKENSYGTADVPYRTQIFEYQDNRTEILAYDAAGALQWRKTVLHNEQDTSRETLLYYPDGTRIKTLRETFDDSGLLVEETHSDEIGNIFSKSTYTYDENKRMIKKALLNYRGKEQTCYYIHYLDDGHVDYIRVEHTDDSYTEEHAYTYTFDEKGNWTERRREHCIQSDHAADSEIFIYIDIRRLQYAENNGAQG